MADEKLEYGKAFKLPKREKDTIEEATYEIELGDVSDLANFNARLIGGNFMLLNSEDETAHCRVQWQVDSPENQRPRMERDGDTLTLNATSWWPFLGQKRAYIIEVYLPARFNVTVTMKAGTMFFEKVLGDLNATVTVGGDIQGYAKGPSVRAQVAAGNVRLHGVRATEVYARATLGDVQILFSDVPTGSTIHLQTSLGDVKARFPEGFLSDHRKTKRKGNIANTRNSNVTVTSSKLGGIRVDDLPNPGGRLYFPDDSADNNESVSVAASSTSTSASASSSTFKPY